MTQVSPKHLQVKTIISQAVSTALSLSAITRSLASRAAPASMIISPLAALIPDPCSDSEFPGQSVTQTCFQGWARLRFRRGRVLPGGVVPGPIPPSVPAGIHHVRHIDGQLVVRDHMKTIGLCSPHHQFHGQGVSVHDGRESWQLIHGLESDLLEQVEALLK